MTNHLKCWAASDTGRIRHHNEDAFMTSAMPEPSRRLSWAGQLHPIGGWALVADGVGASLAGEEASHLALEQLGFRLNGCITDRELLDAIAATNAAILAAQDADTSRDGMATTVVGLILTVAAAIIFNIGDSRAYSLRDGQLRRLSQDHVINGYMLTRCLGSAVADPYIRHIDCLRPSRFLLCTDGITNELSEETIQLLLGSRGDPAAALVNAALAAGGHDNLTAVVVDVPLSNPGEAESAL